ncbi:MAG: hypothetical protein EP344_06710 [Bacteroidetes bacterium]|nr:MAG: hypothetical protein EP344_06710 [Bacteroidota bacterium]
MQHFRLSIVSFLLLTGLTLCTSAHLIAQNRLQYSAPVAGFNLPDKKDAPSFKDRLWYGGGVTLGFSGGAGYSLFAFGVSPMVGYKIVGPLSAGPRLSLLYTSQKYPGVQTFNLFDVELSLFARVRVFRGLFIQGELGTLSDQYVYQDNLGQLGKDTRTRPAQYLGIGYNFSNGAGGVGQEIAVMYDFYVGNDINSYEQPWQYRLAFTYGF